MSLLTTEEAGMKLKRSRGRIVQLIKAGIIPAERKGWMWFIDEEDLDNVVLPRTTGRPRLEGNKRNASTTNEG